MRDITLYADSISNHQKVVTKENQRGDKIKYDIVYAVYKFLSGRYWLATTSLLMIGAVNYAVKEMNDLTRALERAEEDDDYEGEWHKVPEMIIVCSILQPQSGGSSIPSDPDTTPGKVEAVIK